MSYASMDFSFPKDISNIKKSYLEDGGIDMAIDELKTSGMLTFVCSFIAIANDTTIGHFNNPEYKREHDIGEQGLSAKDGRSPLYKAMMLDYVAYVQAQMLHEYLRENDVQEISANIKTTMKRFLEKYPPNYQGNPEILRFLQPHLLEGENFEACKDAITRNFTETDVKKLPKITQILHSLPAEVPDSAYVLSI